MAKLWAFALMLGCTFLTSAAQFLLKKGSTALALNFQGIFLNSFLLSGIFLYLIGALLMIVAFKGGELSTLYPVVATSYIWVSLASFFFLGEAMPTLKWIGVGCIIAGVSCVGIGGART